MYCRAKASVLEDSNAPPLNCLGVYAAVLHPTYEYFSPSQLSSIYDHGGNELYIVTVELGYGHIRYAKFNGLNLKEHMREFIDLNGDNIVDGLFGGMLVVMIMAHLIIKTLQRIFKGIQCPIQFLLNKNVTESG